MGAGWMNMMLSQADFVPISSMSGLMGGGGLRKSQGLVWATPQCLGVLALLASRRGHGAGHRNPGSPL